MTTDLAATADRFRALASILDALPAETPAPVWVQVLGGFDATLHINGFDASPEDTGATATRLIQALEPDFGTPAASTTEVGSMYVTLEFPERVGGWKVSIMTVRATVTA